MHTNDAKWMELLGMFKTSVEPEAIKMLLCKLKSDTDTALWQ